MKIVVSQNVLPSLCGRPDAAGDRDSLCIGCPIHGQTRGVSPETQRENSLGYMSDL